MSDAGLVVLALLAWSVVGFAFFGASAKKIESGWARILTLFVAGPLVWLVFVIAMFKFTMDELDSEERLVEWVALPDYGDLMTMREWTDAVNTGALTDFDGYGYYSDGAAYCREVKIYPSLLGRGRIKGEYTHVLWMSE